MGRSIHRLIGRAAALLALVAAAMAGPACATALVSVGMPDGFADLAQKQQVVADFTFGGRPIGQFAIEFAPGTIRLIDPDRVAAAIPGIADVAAVRAALAAQALDPNTKLACDPAPTCLPPTPEVAAVVFDQRRFHVAIYVNPRFLSIRPVTSEHFLSADRGGWSLVDGVAAAIAGAEGQSPVYDIRNRAIIARGDARIAAETSVSSSGGASLDTLAGQLDRHDMRYTAGVFYAPGIDLTGRRRILGAGFSSQYDTRTDRDQITGTPLIVFLGQRSRVDLLVSGRLMASHSYEAGNQTIDTSALPEGSYAVDIHIQEASGGERTERRFFTKNSRIPPAGKTMIFGDVGVLANDRRGSLLAISQTPLGEAGIARRLSSRLALDATVLATNRKGMIELGAWVMSRAVQARFAVLGSSSGDYGVIAQANSAATGRFGYSFDLRRVWTRNGGPLIPFDDSTSNPFGLDASQQSALLASNSYSQAVVNLSYRLSRAQFGLSGYVRRDRGERTDYAVGPTLHWSIIQTPRMSLGFDGSLAQTERGRTVAAGLHFRLFGARHSFGATAGAQTGMPGDERKVGIIGGVDGSIQRRIGATDLQGSASAQEQQGGGALLQTNVDARSPLGYAAASLVHRADGGQGSTQYALSLQTSFAAGRHVVALGTRQQNDAVIAVSLSGATKNRFEVLVDEAVQGKIGAGDRLTVAVQPYRRYTVRIRPIGGGLVAFDTRARVVDAFPGTVAGLDWKISPQLAMFGRLVHADGTPVADADIRTGDDIAATDDRGWFQLQAAGDAVLTVREAGGRTCHATLDAKPATNGYSPLGTVTCRP